MRRAAPILVLAALVPSSASAYRTSEDSLYNQGNGVTGRIAFEPLPVRYAIHRGSEDLPLASVQAATRAAFETWTEPSCSGLTVSDEGTTTTPAIYGDDRNVLEWVETGWGARGFGSFTIGVTTNQFLRVGDRWTIDESDMELNGDGRTWVLDGGDPVDADPVDVQGLVVHEAGHFVGLLHTCEASAFDGAPACPTFTETPTMAPRYTGEEQRTLTADDVEGICFLYPAPPVPDAGPVTVDAGPTPVDAGPAAMIDAGPAAMIDAGPAAMIDAGTPPARRDGCACRAAPRSSAPPSGLLALSLLLGLRYRPSRRSCSSSRRSSQ